MGRPRLFDPEIPVATVTVCVPNPLYRVWISVLERQGLVLSHAMSAALLYWLELDEESRAQAVRRADSVFDQLKQGTPWSHRTLVPEEENS